MTESGLPMVLILPIPTGILTECTFTIRGTKAINLELDYDTFSNTLHITSPDNSSFLLKLIPIGLSFWFT